MLKTRIKNKGKRGLTLTEMIISMSLFMIIASLGVGAYFDFYRTSLRSNEVQQVITLMKETRFSALKNPTNSDYGIHIDSVNNIITSFRNTYTQGNMENKVLTLGHNRILNLALNPAIGVTNEILFEKQTGKTQNNGNFTLGENNFSRIIEVNLQGLVE